MNDWMELMQNIFGQDGDQLNTDFLRQNYPSMFENTNEEDLLNMFNLLREQQNPQGINTADPILDFQRYRVNPFQGYLSYQMGGAGMINQEQIDVPPLSLADQNGLNYTAGYMSPNMMLTEMMEKGGTAQDKKLWSRVKAAAKTKFDVFPSRMSQEYKKRGGKFKELGGSVDKIDDYEKGGKSKLTRGGITFSGYNKPKRTPNHKSKSHAVLAKEGDKVKLIRFGQQGVKGAGSNPKTEKQKNRRKSFKARHAKNIKKGKMSAAYWASKTKW